MKIIKVVLLALVMMIASSCGEKKINEHRVLSKPELEIALIGNAHFVQYIEGLIEHDAQITESICPAIVDLTGWRQDGTD